MSRKNKMSVTLSDYHTSRLKTYSQRLKLPLARLIAMAVDNELAKSEPYKGISFELYKDVKEYAYAKEAQRISDYMDKLGHAVTVDFLYSHRHDIGLKTLEEVIGGFSELMRASLLVEVKPSFVKTIKGGNKYYKLYDESVEEKEAKEYARYLRLAKKFEKNKETKISGGDE